MNLIKFRKWSTPITIGSFIIVGVSGILMFFKIRFGLLTVAHEWISIVLVIGSIFHIAGNFDAFKRYFKKPVSLAAISIITLIGIAAFAVPGNSHERKPILDLTEKMQNISLTLAAQITETDPGSIQTHLKSHGLDVLDANLTINEIAALNKTDSQNVLSIVFEDN